MTAATSRLEKTSAGQKLASGIFFKSCTFAHLETPLQVTETHQENATCIYNFASGCAVGPNSSAYGQNAQTSTTSAGPFGQEQYGPCAATAIRNGAWLFAMADPGEKQIRERLGTVSKRKDGADFTTSILLNSQSPILRVLESYGLKGSWNSITNQDQVNALLTDGTIAFVGYDKHIATVLVYGDSVWAYNTGGDFKNARGMNEVNNVTMAGLLSDFLAAKTYTVVVPVTTGPVNPIQILLPPTRPK